MIRAHKTSRTLPCSAHALFRLLSDYDRYQDWLPGITRSRILVREGDIVIAEFEAARFSARPITFEFIQQAPTQIIFNQVGQLRERGLSGAWTLREQSGQPGVILDGKLELKIPWLNLLAGAALRTALDESLGALLTRIETGRGAGPVDGGDTRRKLLEIRRRAGLLEVWYQGQVFTSPLNETEQSL